MRLLLNEPGEMLPSSAAIRELVVSFEQELIGMAAIGGEAHSDPREQVAELTKQFLNQLLGMDVDVS